MQNQRHLFVLRKSSIFLNCAFMSPLLKSVRAAGIQGIDCKANPAAVTADHFFRDSEVLRREFAALIGVSDPKRIAIIPSVSYGLAAVTRNIRLSQGDEIVVAAEQFPSNYYPWSRLAGSCGAQVRVVHPPTDAVQRGRVWNERILESIGPQTRVVSLGHVHWTDGTRFDLATIRTRTREVGAQLIVDGTQSVGALPFSAADYQPDALICAGYKWLMGPYSIGMAYFGEAFDGGMPIEENWINRYGSEDFTALVRYQDRYQDGSLRYDVGERSNFVLTPMMIAALRQVRVWRPERIQEYCERVSRRAIRRLRENGFWIEDEAHRGRHLFGIRLPQAVDTDTIRKRLGEKRISVSFRGSAIRVSPHLYNTAEEMDLLADVLIGREKRIPKKRNR